LSVTRRLIYLSCVVFGWRSSGLQTRSVSQSTWHIGQIVAFDRQGLPLFNCLVRCQIRKPKFRKPCGTVPICEIQHCMVSCPSFPSPTLFFPSLLFLPLPFSLLPSIPFPFPSLLSLPLEVGLLKTNRGFRGVLYASPAGCEAQPQPKSNLVHCNFEIWCLVATIFTRTSLYVTFGSLLSQFRLSVFCLLSVCNVGAPYSGVEAFGNISSPLCTLAIP